MKELDTCLHGMVWSGCRIDMDPLAGLLDCKIHNRCAPSTLPKHFLGTIIVHRTPFARLSFSLILIFMMPCSITHARARPHRA